MDDLNKCMKTGIDSTSITKVECTVKFLSRCDELEQGVRCKKKRTKSRNG